MTTKNKNATQIILLNGPSVKNIKKYTIHKNDTVYAVNRKSTIEERLLKPKGRNVDVWAVIPDQDLKEMYSEIEEYLLRDQDNRLITTSQSLLEINYLLETRPLPNPHKIITIDGLCHDIVSKLKGGLNSLAVILCFLALKKQNQIAVFGCDGLSNPDSKNVYCFQEEHLHRLSRNNIYRDTTRFNKYYPDLIKSYEEIGSKLNIYNANPKSYYLTFSKENNLIRPKKNVEKFIIPSNSESLQNIIKKGQYYKSIEILSLLKRKSKENLFKKLLKKFKTQ